MLRLFGNHGHCSCCALLLVFLFFCAPASAALDQRSQAKVRAATFEVVVPKPTEDPLTYEKPLPLDLLPYNERTDKYHSIGTAFSLGGGRYVTAAHVLQF